jgi:uncharacterized coiled-coil protein SlyX
MTDKYVHNVTNGVTTITDDLPTTMSDINDTQQLSTSPQTETDTSDSEYESASSSDSETDLPATKSSPPQRYKNVNNPNQFTLPDTSPDPLAMSTPHKKRRTFTSGTGLATKFTFQAPFPQPDFHAQLKQWIKAALDSQTFEMNASFQVAIAAATQPLLQKIDKLETTTASLEAKLKALKDATSSQANKINKISSDSQHIKKKLATTTSPTQEGDTTPTNKEPSTYAKAAASGIPQRLQPPPKQSPTPSSTSKGKAPAATNAPQLPSIKPITI